MRGRQRGPPGVATRVEGDPCRRGKGDCFATKGPWGLTQPEERPTDGEQARRHAATKGLRGHQNPRRRPAGGMRAGVATKRTRGRTVPRGEPRNERVLQRGRDLGRRTYSRRKTLCRECSAIALGLRLKEDKARAPWNLYAEETRELRSTSRRSGRKGLGESRTPRRPNGRASRSRGWDWKGPTSRRPADGLSEVLVSNHRNRPTTEIPFVGRGVQQSTTVGCRRLVLLRI